MIGGKKLEGNVSTLATAANGSGLLPETLAILDPLTGEAGVLSAPVQESDGDTALSPQTAALLADRGVFRMRLCRERASARITGSHELVQAQFGRAVLRLRTVKALALALFGRLDQTAVSNCTAIDADDRGLRRVVAAQVSELALETVQRAFRRSGFAALRHGGIFEKLLRDMNVAATHWLVDASAFAKYAEQVLEHGLLLSAFGTIRRGGA